MRASGKRGEATSLRADGLVLVKKTISRPAPPRSAPFKGSGRDIFLGVAATPPPLSSAEQGNAAPSPMVADKCRVLRCRYAVVAISHGQTNGHRGIEPDIYQLSLEKTYGSLLQSLAVV